MTLRQQASNVGWAAGMHIAQASGPHGRVQDEGLAYTLSREAFHLAGLAVRAEESRAALCPACGRVGYVAGLSGWWFWCKPCDRRWGHPQSYTLDTANAAASLAAASITPVQDDESLGDA